MEKKKIRTSFLRIFLLILAIFISFGAGVALGFVGGLVKDQPVLDQKEMKEQINNISKNSEVYFGTGEKLGTLNSELIRKTVSYDELGENVKNATIASEDSDFYSNNGVEIFGLIRAVYSEVTGAHTSGGSTITQQLVKNQLLDNSRSYERKAKEILLALRVDNHFSKKEILENYLNVAQAAYLVGFVQSPYRYTPFDNAGNIRPDEELQAGIERQKYVLSRMKANNFINSSQYREALDFDIKGSFTKQKVEEYTEYPYIRDEVTAAAAEILAEQTAVKNNRLQQFRNNATYRAELIEKSKTKFITGGYKVKTTLDKKLYDKLQETKKQFESYPASYQNGTTYPLEIGASVIENDTGKVLAFIGGMNYKKQQLNHATRTKRSPGSSIKPLLVYGPAIDKGYITPNSTILDKRFNYYGWTPENFTRTEYGYISARKALAQSLNLSTIRLYSAFVNEDPVKEYLEKMEFKGMTETDHTSLAASIGGMSYGVSVMENTSGFSTFANMGQHKKAYIIEEIRNNNNEIIYQANHTPIRVYNDSTSYLILNMLNDVINASYGTSADIAKQLNFSSKNLFVKTGTSEYYKDLWVVGGTKNITVGVWNGYDKPATVPSYDYAHKSWAAIMNAIYSYDSKLVSPDVAFTRPNSVIDFSINPYNNAKGSVSDMIPNGFVELTKEKTLAKLGFSIDKDLTFGAPRTIMKKDDKEKDDKNKNEEPHEHSSDNDTDD